MSAGTRRQERLMASFGAFGTRKLPQSSRGTSAYNRLYEACGRLGDDDAKRLVSSLEGKYDEFRERFGAVGPRMLSDWIVAEAEAGTLDQPGETR